MVPRYARDHLEVKKVSISSKNPSKWPIICFARIKEIISRPFRISGTLIVIMHLIPTLCTFQFHAHFPNRPALCSDFFRGFLLACKLFFIRQFRDIICTLKYNLHADSHFICTYYLGIKMFVTSQA